MFIQQMDMLRHQYIFYCFSYGISTLLKTFFKKTNSKPIKSFSPDDELRLKLDEHNLKICSIKEIFLLITFVHCMCVYIYIYI